MAYVQRFVPRGTDLATLDYFMRNRLEQVVPEPEQQQLLAQQVYDLALSKGVKQGNLRIEDLDYILREMQQGITAPLQDIAPMQNPLQPGVQIGTVPGEIGPASGDLMPRTAFQSPMEAMQPARYFSSGDALADSAGAFTYRFIDDLTLGMIGGLGGIMKRIGLTEKNFWSESIGESEDLFGLDFGASGIKTGDTTAGQWFQRAGQALGFVGPIAATAGGALAAKVPAALGAKAAQAAIKAERAGAVAAAKGLRQAAARHKAVETGIRAGAQKTADILNKAPVNVLFRQGGKAVQKVLVGEALNGVASKALVDAVAGSKVLGTTLNAVRSKAVTGAVETAARAGASEALRLAQHQSPAAIKAAAGLAKGAGKAIEEGVYANPEVIRPATDLFENIFMRETIQRLGLDVTKAGHADLLHKLSTNAVKVFEDSLMASRKTGLLSAQEKAFRSGAGLMGMTLARAGEHAASHVVNMTLLGAITRVAHPLSEPEAFGISEDDNWQATKDIAKYWVRGAKASPFEGIAGDIFVGTMFGTAGGLRLIPAFQSNRVKNPAEMFSIMLGGSPDRWKGAMTRVDRALAPIYDMAQKAGREATEESGGLGGYIRRYLRRNKADFDDIAKHNPAGFGVVAKNYLQWMERNPDLVGPHQPFNTTDVFNAMRTSEGLTGPAAKVAEDARNKIVAALSSHFDKYMDDYTRLGRRDLAKDMAQFGLLATATSFASAPQLWLSYAEGDSGIHPADLVVHTLLSTMMSRQPYYMEGGNQYLRATSSGQPVTPEMQSRYNLMRLRGALRNLGVKDSAYIFDGTEGNASTAAEALSPMQSDEMLNRAAKTAGEEISSSTIETGPPRYKLVVNTEDAGVNTVTARELREFIRHLQKRRAARANISNEVLMPDIDGKSLALAGDLEGNPVVLNRLIQTLGHFKNSLREAGHMSEGELFRYSSVGRADVAFFQKAIGAATKLMTTSKLDRRPGDSGFIGAMKAIVGEGKNGELRYVSLKASDDNPIDPVIQRAVEGYNELVSIARDFRMAKVDLTDKGVWLPREIDLATERDVFAQADELVANASKMFADEFGVDPTINLGSGKFKNMLNEGLLEAHMSHSTVFAMHKGVLFAPNGEMVNVERTVLKYLHERGLIFPTKGSDGKTVFVTREIDLADYEGSAGAGRPKKADILRNFFNYLGSLDGVTIRFVDPYSDKKEPSIGKEQLDELFSDNAALSDARDGVDIAGYKGGLMGLLKDVGLSFDNKYMIGEYVRDIHRARGERFDERHVRFLTAARAAGLTIRDKYGNERISPAVLAEINSPDSEYAAGIYGKGADLPEYMQVLAEDIGNGSIRPALSPENLKFFRKMIAELTAGGRISGSTMPLDYFETGGEMPDGMFRAFNREDHPNLEQFVRELDYLRERSVGDAIAELDSSIGAVAEAAASISNKQKGWRRRKTNMNKLMRLLLAVKNSGGSNFMLADKFMVEKGYLKLGDGKAQIKKYITDDRKLAKMVTELEEFLVNDLNRRIAADDTIDRQVAQSRAEQMRRRYFDKESPDRPSAAHFMVDIGFDSNHTAKADAHGAIRGVGEMLADPVKSGLSPEYAAAELRHGLRQSIKKHFFGVERDRALKSLGQYSDNYLLSLINETASTPVDVLSLKPGTDYKKNVIGGPGGTGKPTTGIAQLELPSAFGSSKRTNFKIAIRSVMNNSADLRMSARGFGDFKYLSREALKIMDDIGQQRVDDDLFSNGISGRYVDSRHNVSERGFAHAIRLREIRQGGGDMLVEVPHNAETAIKFIDAARDMLADYEKLQILSIEDLGPQIERLKFIVDQLEAAINSGVDADGAVAKFSLKGGDFLDNAAMNSSNGNRIQMWRDTYRLIRLNNYFGAEAVVEAFNREHADPSSRALNKLVARSNLSANSSTTSVSKGTFGAAMRSFLDSEGGISSAGRRMSVTEFAADQGLTIDANGEISGFKAYVFDGAAANAEKGAAARETENMPSGIWMRRSSIMALWHSMGHNTDAGVAGFGVAKVRFWDQSKGTFITKDVIAADAEMEALMDRHGVNMIVSKDAIKVSSGKWAGAVKNATIRYDDGSVDLIGKLREGSAPTEGSDVIRRSGEDFTATPMEIPIESMRWTHAVDTDPSHASRAPNMTQFKSEAYVEAISKIIQDKQARIVDDFARLFGGLSRRQGMLLGYLMSNRGRILNDNEMSKAVNVSGKAYMELGGHLAGALDYGADTYVMDVLKNKMITDEIFRLRTNNGTQAVYTDDMRGVLNVGEAVAPFQDAFLTQDFESGHAAFRMWDPGLASRANAETFEWGERPNHFNSEGDPDRPGVPQPDVESDIAHFPIWRTGRGTAVYNGLMAMRRSPRKFSPRYRTMARDGSFTEGKGATEIHRLIRRLAPEQGKSDDPKALAAAESLAEAYSDAWQAAMRSHVDQKTAAGEVARILRKGAGGLTDQEQVRLVAEIMQSRREAYGELMNADGTLNGLILSGNGGVENYRMMNALGFMFGGYDYYARSMQGEGGLGSQTFGISSVSQRHPRMRSNDNVPLMLLGYLDRRDGNQIKMNYRDAEMKQMADQDEDHIHFWHDYGRDELGEALRNRALGGLLTTPTVAPMKQRRYFQSSDDTGSRTYDDEWVDRQNWGKAGIGLISKALTTASEGLRREIAFEIDLGGRTYLVAPKVYVDPNTGMIHDNPKVSVTDRTQSLMQGAFRRLEIRHSQFLDTKAGSSQNPRDIDLQAEVLSEFFGLWEKDAVTGQYRSTPRGLLDRDEAMSSLKAALSPWYRISSLGKDIVTSEGSQQMHTDDLLHLSSRYDAVVGPDADVRARLEDLIAQSIGKGVVQPLPGKRGKAVSRMANAGAAQTARSVRVITSSEALKRNGVYDVMASTVLKAEGAMWSQERRAFLSEEENAAFYQGNEAMKLFEPPARTASAAHWVANYQKMGNMLMSLNRRVEDGESMLVTEANAVRSMMRSGADFWKQTEAEESFSRGQRTVPRNPLELHQAMQSNADAKGIHLARAMALLNDRDGGNERARVQDAEFIRSQYKQLMRQLMNDQKFKDPRVVVDNETLTGIVDNLIEEYMIKWGKDGNEVVAALDLLAPEPFGYFVHRGTEIVRYRAFPQPIFSGIIKYLGGSMGSPTRITPMWGDAALENLMTLMARSRATATAVLSGDPAGLHELHSMIEMTEAGGRSVMGALQYNQLKSPSRRGMARENVYLAHMNSGMNGLLEAIPESGFGNPKDTMLGFTTSRSAERFLYEAVNGGDSVRRARVLNTMRQQKSPIPSHLLDDSSLDEVATVSIYHKESDVIGRLESSLRRGEQENMEREQALKPKNKREKEVDDFTRNFRIRERESVQLRDMLRSLDANIDKKPSVLKVDQMSTSSSSAQMVLDWMDTARMRQGVCY